jgi:hypothetical protein
MRKVHFLEQSVFAPFTQTGGNEGSTMARRLRFTNGGILGQGRSLIPETR